MYEPKVVQCTHTHLRRTLGLRSYLVGEAEAEAVVAMSDQAAGLLISPGWLCGLWKGGPPGWQVAGATEGQHDNTQRLQILSDHSFLHSCQSGSRASRQEETQLSSTCDGRTLDRQWQLDTLVRNFQEEGRYSLCENSRIEPLFLALAATGGLAGRQTITTIHLNTTTRLVVGSTCTTLVQLYPPVPGTWYGVQTVLAFILFANLRKILVVHGQ
jgi:hypothetical protein